MGYIQLENVKPLNVPSLSSGVHVYIQLIE